MYPDSPIPKFFTTSFHPDRARDRAEIRLSAPYPFLDIFSEHHPLFLIFFPSSTRRRAAVASARGRQVLPSLSDLPPTLPVATRRRVAGDDVGA